MKRILSVLLLLMFGCIPSCSNNTEATAALPILVYHHIAQVGDGYATVSADVFASHMQGLYDRGFDAVSFADVIAYVDRGVPLPDKPICIVFDDGYESNYSIAYPILKKLGFNATVALITSSVGNTEYKQTGVKIIPHLSWEQAREMYASGAVYFAGHTHDMHMSAVLEPSPARENCSKLASESAETHAAAFIYDHEMASYEFSAGLGYVPKVFAYPHGVWDTYSENLLRNLGYRVTLITEEGVNVLACGDHDCLYLMRRFTVTDNTDFDRLLDGISRFY